MVKPWKGVLSISVSKQVHFFAVEENLFPLLLFCLAYLHVHLLISYQYPSGKHEHQQNKSTGLCREKGNSAICFNFSKEEMKAAANECGDDKVNFAIIIIINAMSSYCLSKTLWPKGIPGLINTVSTRRSYSCTLRFSSSAPSCDHFSRLGEWKKILATKILAKVG